MLNWLLLASFPSNEPNTPSSFVVLVTAALLVSLFVWLTRQRSFSFGAVTGAVVFAFASGALFWPRVMREPYAPNPGPFIVVLGAFSGDCLGAVAAVIGKFLHRCSPRKSIQTLKQQFGTFDESACVDAPLHTVRFAKRKSQLIQSIDVPSANGRSKIDDRPYRALGESIVGLQMKHRFAEPCGVGVYLA